MSANFFDLQKFAATGIASADMSAYDKMRALAAFGGGKTQTLTGIPPLSFPSNGSPITIWSMIGNAQQTGTPSPNNIIMPTFCGVRTRNLCPMIFSHSGVGDDVGAVITMSTRLWSSKIAVSPSQSYYAMINGEASNHEELLFNRIIQYDANGDFISRISVVNQTEAEITTAENCRFVVLDIRTRTLTVDITMDDITAVMLSAGSQASYEPYGWAEKITCAGQTTPVYLGQTQTVRQINKLVLDGTENWNSTSGRCYLTSLPVDYLRSQGETTYICTHYPCTGQVNGASQVSAGTLSMAYGNNQRLYVYDEDYSTADQFKAYLAAQYANGTPVTVWYVLATQETAIVNEPLCKIGNYADELYSADAGVSIPTVKGENTLTVDTEMQPSEMTITYKS